jgi:hypothetical protein
MKRPVILYSWPSAPKLFDYFVDNNNSEWSQGHFRRFIKHLEDFKETHPLQVVFVAHSMGNRFLLRAVHELFRKNIAVDLELVSADIDLDTCRHYLLGFHRVDNKAPIRFYVSNKDRMLKLSQRVFGGYDRLGENVEHKLGPSRAVQQIIIRKDKDMRKALENEVEDSDDDEKSNNARAQNELLDPEVFEVVDFTALDQGFTGHSMPYQLIADMVNGKQSVGIKVVTDETKTFYGKKALRVLK